MGREFETLMNLKPKDYYIYPIQSYIFKDKLTYMVVSTSITVKFTVIIA